MQPIAIFRHAAHEGPGYFAQFLNNRAIPWQLIAIDRADIIPTSPEKYAGLVFMGGPMSVNDDLAWISASLNLIRLAVAADIPVLGHCLGGQLIAKALGGVISRNPVKEIGWGSVQVAAQDWLGDIEKNIESFQSFHWHGETFSLPAGATRLLSSVHCENQAFVLGKHLALQCHVEMTHDMIEQWCAVGADEIAAAADSPGVQSAAQIMAQTDALLAPLHHVADKLYSRWLQGVAT